MCRYIELYFSINILCSEFFCFLNIKKNLIFTNKVNLHFYFYVNKFLFSSRDPSIILNKLEQEYYYKLIIPLSVKRKYILTNYKGFNKCTLKKYMHKQKILICITYHFN